MEREAAFRLPPPPHPPGPRGLSRPDLSVLFLRRLDNLAALEVEADGRPGLLHLAFLSPPRALEEDWRVLPPKPFHQYLDLDLWGEVMALEEELSRQARVLEVRDGSGSGPSWWGWTRGRARRRRRSCGSSPS